MRRLLLAAAVLPLLAASARPGEEATDAAAGDDPLRAAEVRRLVWAAADAPEKALDAALDELRGFPDVTWREVHDVLAAGRDYAEIEPPGPPADDLAALTAAMAAVPWRPGEVQVLDLGTTPELWYRATLPPGYDGSEPLAVLVDVGGIARLPEGDPARPGFVFVTVNDLLFHVPDLGGVGLNLTAGTVSQTIVLSVVSDLERRVNVDRDRVFVGGYSRGGNATLYFAAHWPDLWAGAIPASGYYPVERDTWPNLRHVGVLSARGKDRFHRGANDFMRTLGGLLRDIDHPDLTEHVADEKAVDRALHERLFPWMAERRRDPLPDVVEYTWRDPRHRGAYWVEVLEAKDTAGTRPVVIGAPGDTTAETFPVHRRPSWVRVERTADDEVEVRAKNVARLRLLLSPARFDLSKPLTVRVGSRSRTFDVTPTVGGLLRRFRRDRDRSRLFPAAVDVDL